MTKVSIILPVYDINSKMLRVAIDSILLQSYSNIELLIICDKSDVKVDLLLNEYELKDKRLKVIRNKKRIGIAESLNLGIRSSSGQYIARMDGDDISVSTRIEKQVEYLNSHKEVDVVFTRSGAINENGRRIFRPSYKLSDSQLISSLFIGCMVFHPTVMIRKDVLIKTNCFYDGRHFVEDYDLWTRLVLSGVRLHQMNDILYLYRIHANQTTIKVKDNAVSDSLRILHSFIVGRGIDVSIEDTEKYRIYMTSKNKITANFRNTGKAVLKKIAEQNYDDFDIHFLNKRALVLEFIRWLKI